MKGLDGEGELVAMLDHVAEWCLDWYGEYQDGDQVDPVGADSGIVRVLRGNKQDASERAIAPWGYNRPAYRAGMPPKYGLPFLESDVSFRVVQAPPPESRPHPAEQSLFTLGVKQSTGMKQCGIHRRPPKPYFRKRYLVPSPPESSEGNNYERPEPQQEMRALALHPGLGGHQHNAALEVMANGDLLFMCYSCWTEYNPEVGFMAARLRVGEDQWEMPSIGFDLVGVNDHGPLLWSDGNQTHLFWAIQRSPRCPLSANSRHVRSLANGNPTRVGETALGLGGYYRATTGPLYSVQRASAALRSDSPSRPSRG